MSENFHQDLHEFCKSFAERWDESLSDPMDGYKTVEDGYKTVEYVGAIEANYPWHYIRFTYRGSMLWSTFDVMVKEVQEFCAKNQGASFQRAEFNAVGQNRTNLKFTLVYNLQAFT